ncbi:MAG TPA: calcium/sodium antiporter [Bacteroidales bacterium]|nr:calcium/sodium antiporter [Bacteroidales bacterium]
MILDVLSVFGGLVLLYFGASFLIKGAVSVAMRAGVSVLVVGLTVVAYGTSMPEMVVSTMASFKDAGDIAVGNVVGSNIFNIAVILGISSLISPMRVNLKVLRFDTPVMLGVALLFLLIFADFRISRLDAILLFVLAVAYTVFNIVKSRKDEKKAEELGIEPSISKIPRSVFIDIGFILLGIGVLILGSNFLVTGSTALARVFGASEAFIGLTIVAAGTSLPELATSLVAALKKQSDIAIGNVVGSNIFNILAILGISGIIHPIEATGISSVDILVMIGFSALVIPLMKTDVKISRREGAIMLLAYIAYVAYLLYV